MIRSTVDQTTGSNTPALHIPTLYADASTRRVLTIEFVSGTPLSRAGSRLDAMPSPGREALARGLMAAVLSEILLYGSSTPICTRPT